MNVYIVNVKSMDKWIEILVEIDLCFTHAMICVIVLCYIFLIVIAQLALCRSLLRSVSLDPKLASWHVALRIICK